MMKSRGKYSKSAADVDRFSFSDSLLSFRSSFLSGIKSQVQDVEILFIICAFSFFSHWNRFVMRDRWSFKRVFFTNSDWNERLTDSSASDGEKSFSSSVFQVRSIENSFGTSSPFRQTLDLILLVRLAHRTTLNKWRGWKLTWIWVFFYIRWCRSMRFFFHWR